MRKSLRTLGMLASLSLVAAGTAACSSHNEATSEGQSGSGSAASDGADLQGEVTFQTWNLKNDKYTPYFEGLVKDYEDANPGTKINWVDAPAEGYQQKLSADAAGGSLPDIVDMGPEAAYSLAQAGALLDINEADADAKELFLPKAWEAMTFDGLGGGTYGFPWYLNTGPAFFNKQIFEDCGLDAEKLPSTYDELFDQAEILSANCPDKTMIARMPVIENFGEYGAQLMNTDQTEFTFNDAAGAEFVERYQKLFESRGLDAEALDNLQTKEVEEFKAGNVAYTPGSSYTFFDLKDTAPDIFKVLGMGPRIANTEPNMYIESLAINANSKNQELALDFAKFVTNSDNQFEFAKSANVFPSSAGTIDDPYFTTVVDGDEGSQVRVESAEQVRHAVVWWPPAFSGAVDEPELREQIAQAVLGQRTAQEALDQAVSFSNQRIKDNAR